jgi:hypothetical protein
MPDPDRLLTTLRQAVTHWRGTSGRAGRVLTLTNVRDILICGDLHGNVERFRTLMNRAELDKNGARHLVLQEIIHGPFRYPTGGDKSHQLLDLISALTCRYPGRVHYLLGNHELAQWHNQHISKGDDAVIDLFRQGVSDAYGSRADEIYAAYVDLFAAAVAIIRTPHRIIMSHSLPSARHQARFSLDILQRDAWQTEDVKYGGALHSLVWGRDTTLANVTAYLAKVDGDLLISGHIPCDNGFAVPNERQLVLDAAGTPACYCLFPADRTLTQSELVALVERLE